MKFIKYLLVTLSIITLYVVTAIPLGLFLYTWKMDLGINVFSSTGFHSYIGCLKQEAQKINVEDFTR